MESSEQQAFGSVACVHRWCRAWRLCLAALALGAALSACAHTDTPAAIKPTLHHFLRDMPRTVRADHPAIAPVAAAIRAVTTDPLEQLVMVNDVTHLLVDYDEDEDVYGVPEYYATLDEMLARRRAQGWLYLRDDCDGRAVFAAHLLAALGIPWRLEASFWKRHAWVVARVAGHDYDLLDFHPDSMATRRLSYRLVGHWFVHASHQPPPFDWRRRWAGRTGSDLPTGFVLGMLALDSTPGHLHERHATDWTKQSPDARSAAIDPRTPAATCAGFPYGETLRFGDVAATMNVASPSPSPAAAPESKTPASGLAGDSASRQADSPAPTR